MPEGHAEHFPGPIHQPPLASNVDAIQPAAHAEHAHHPKLQHHFDDMEQQAEASTLGMWVFLVTEIMFFGGLFMAYLRLPVAGVPEAFQEASHHLNIPLGAFNTAVLICQLADDGARRARRADQRAGEDPGRAGSSSR